MVTVKVTVTVTVMVTPLNQPPHYQFGRQTLESSWSRVLRLHISALVSQADNVPGESKQTYRHL